MRKNRRVLLLEPPYKNKYPPMGLMKLATYFRDRGDDVRFFKGNLKDFAAALLCEEYLRADLLKSQDKYSAKFFEYIKTGKYAAIDTIPNFRGSEDEHTLKQYRKKFITECYPQFDIICVTSTLSHSNMWI